MSAHWKFAQSDLHEYELICIGDAVKNPYLQPRSYFLTRPLPHSRYLSRHCHVPESRKYQLYSCLLLTKEKSVTWATYCNNEVRFWAQLKLSIFRICKAQSQRLEVVCSITNWFEGFGTFPTDGEAFILECIFQLLPFQVCFYLEKGNFVRSCKQINRNEPEPSNENSPKKLQRCMLESWSKCKYFHYQKLLEGPWY